MKRYQLLIDIEEGSDEFWEELERNGTTGCDEITDEIKEALRNHGLDYQVKLISFTDK